MYRRYWPTALGLLAAVVLGWYLLYTELLMREMRRDARVHSSIYIEILRGLQDPQEGAAERTLLSLSQTVQDLGIPIVLTDPEGIPTASSNTPFDADANDPDDQFLLYAYAQELGERNVPITEPGLGTIYYGDPPLVQRMRYIPWLQVSVLASLLLASALMIRHNQRLERERIWATIARESAHQMATPLSSLAGWVEILRLPSEEREEMTTLPVAAAEMEADLDRLEKVAHRFEWIGRPVRKEAVDVRALLKTLERYVRIRMPQIARGVELRVETADALPPVLGNAVLLEWALENLMKNALDALAGSGGTIDVSAERVSPWKVAIRVRDDGPGVSQAIRNSLFEPGVTTKKGGWGVGLSLARRIVEDVHNGRLTLSPTEKGAMFVATLPVADPST
ncbi:MAG: HAMP domain-containing histidine kinase [Gemmatimonadetes bacterium]|nr:HAMP domain-containing histidine kinase [Gemmatimonadota bacterium]